MLSTVLTQKKSHKNFYQDCYFRALNFLVFNLSLIIALLVVSIILALNRPEPHYYATSISGIITPLNALTTPNYSQTPLIE